jgi:DNA repair exonuclease SbcCD ATPase subunit
MNADAQVEIMKLVIMWTLIGAFIFTVIITLLSMIGVVKFADRKQQGKMFAVIVVQVAVVCVGVFTGKLQASPAKAVEKVQQPLKEENKTLTREKTDLEGEKATLASQLTDTKQQFASVQESLQQVTQEKDAALGQYKLAMQQTEELKDRFSKLTAAAPDNRSDEYRAQIAELTARLQNAEKERDEARVSSEALLAKAKESEAALKQMQAKQNANKRSNR